MLLCLRQHILKKSLYFYLDYKNNVMKERAAANNYPSPKVIDLNRGNVVSISESRSRQPDALWGIYTLFLCLNWRNGENVMQVIHSELLAGPDRAEWEENQGLYIYIEKRNGITVFLQQNYCLHNLIILKFCWYW